MSDQSVPGAMPRGEAQSSRRPSGGYILRNVQQYLAQRQFSLLIPLQILVLMLAISVVIVLLIGIRTGLPVSPEMGDWLRGNIGSVMSFPGFLIMAGAMCANHQFPAALAFGSTRHNFWIGTMIGFSITSLATGLFALIGLGLELLTNHWWIGVHAFDVSVLGDGNPASTMVIIALLSMASLLIGATYGMVFRSYGAKMLTVSLIFTGVVFVMMLAVIIWQIDAVVRFFTPWGAWMLAAGSGVVALVAGFAGYWVCRRASF